MGSSHRSIVTQVVYQRTQQKTARALYIVWIPTVDFLDRAEVDCTVALLRESSFTMR